MSQFLLLLEFIFRGPWTFFGCCILFFMLGLMIEAAAKFRPIGFTKNVWNEPEVKSETEEKGTHHVE